MHRDAWVGVGDVGGRAAGEARVWSLEVTGGERWVAGGERWVAGGERLGGWRVTVGWWLVAGGWRVAGGWVTPLTKNLRPETLVLFLRALKRAEDGRVEFSERRDEVLALRNQHLRPGERLWVVSSVGACLGANEVDDRGGLRHNHT